MRRRAIGTILVMTTMAYMSCSSDPASPPVVTRAELEQQRLSEMLEIVRPSVERSRGLSFQRPVFVAELSRSEHRAAQEALFANWLTEERNSAITTQYRQMGLLSESDPTIRELYTDNRSTSSAAFYRTGTDSIYFVESRTVPDSLLDFLMSHELVHALQDQHLGLSFPVVPALSHLSSDARIAQRAVVEGDATALAYMQFAKYIRVSRAELVRVASNEWLRDFVSFQLDYDSPYWIAVESGFPYPGGFHYIAGILGESLDFDLVDALYSTAAMPRSSREVLIGQPFDEKHFEYTGVHELLVGGGEDITFFDDDNAGAIMLMALFYDDVPASVVSSGFSLRGDRYTFALRDGEEFGTLVWTLSFEDGADAERIFKKLDTQLRNRTLGAHSPFWNTVEESFGDHAFSVIRWYRGDLFESLLVRNDSEIYWIENAGTLTESILVELEGLSETGTSAGRVARIGAQTMLSSATKQEICEAILQHRFRPGPHQR